jgi:hypothetical protein
MMQPARGPRKTTNLSEPVRKQLNLYALAAGAAGVGLLASSQPLQAEVVFTATHIRLANGKIPIDLNNDGTVDFTVSNKSAGGSCCLYQRVLNVTGAFVGSSQNGVIGVSRYANAIKPGQAIGPRQLFLFAPMIMATAFNDSNSFFFVSGPFANTTNRFLGLTFTINGQRFYGWARFNIKAGFTDSHQPVVIATLTGYAYETVPGQQIIAGQTKGASASLAAPTDAAPAPQPATLGLLATGALGLNVWRKSEPLIAAQ